MRCNIWMTKVLRIPFITTCYNVHWKPEWKIQSVKYIYTILIAFILKKAMWNNHCRKAGNYSLNFLIESIMTGSYKILFTRIIIYSLFTWFDTSTYFYVSYAYILMLIKVFSQSTVFTFVKGRVFYILFSLLIWNTLDKTVCNK